MGGWVKSEGSKKGGKVALVDSDVVFFLMVAKGIASNLGNALGI